MVRTETVAAHEQCAATAAPADPMSLDVVALAVAGRRLHAAMPAEVVLNLADRVDHREHSLIADRDYRIARDRLAAATIDMDLPWRDTAAASPMSMDDISQDIGADITMVTLPPTPDAVMVVAADLLTAVVDTK